MFDAGLLFSFVSVPAQHMSCSHHIGLLKSPTCTTVSHVHPTFAHAALLRCSLCLRHSSFQTSLPPDGNTSKLDLSSNLSKNESESCPVMSDSLQPGGLYSPRNFLQARILEWVAIPFFREFSQPRDRTQISHVAGRFFTS